MECAILGMVVGIGALTQLPPCEQERRAEVAFSSRDASDILTVRIHGVECFRSELETSIHTHGGELAYRYAAPFKRHTASQWDEPGLPGDAKRFVDDLIRDAQTRLTTHDLPPYGGDSERFWGTSSELPRDAYERLRQEERPMFCHLTGYEVGQCVVFDQARGLPLTVLEWGS